MATLDFPLSSEPDYQLWMYEKLKEHVQASAVETKVVFTYFPTRLDIYCLGLTIVIGGQYFGWNAALDVGFGGALLHLLLIGSAYISLTLCTAEVSSAIPFAGGAFGLARITLGEYLGFMVGISEALEYIIYVACSCVTLSLIIFESLGISEENSHLIVLFNFMFYASSLLIYIYSGKYFWAFSTYIGLVSLFFVVVYVFGALTDVNFSRFAVEPSSNLFRGGVYEWLARLPLACWWYVGVESMVFSADEIKIPKKTLPFCSICCVLTLFCTSIMVLFTCSSSAPGAEALASEASPLLFVFGKIFRCTTELANIFTLPAVFATAFGFMYPSGKLLQSLAMSNLIPSVLQARTASGVPHVALCVSSALGYGLSIYCYFYPAFVLWLFDLCMLFAFCAYISQCFGYITLQSQYVGVERDFRSPLGVYGAYYAICVFLLGILSLVAFQDDVFIFVAFAVTYFIMSVYYFVVAEKSQKMSLEEERAHLALLIIRYRKEIEYRSVLMAEIASSSVERSFARSSKPSNSSNCIDEDDLPPKVLEIGNTSFNPVRSSESISCPIGGTREE